MSWKRYQEETAKYFLSLGCDAKVNEKVIGARAEHYIDVLVRFKMFGFEIMWIIECKYWNTSVPKRRLWYLSQ